MRFPILLLVLTALNPGFLPTAAAPAVAPEIRQFVERIYPELHELYRHLHSYPELSFQEEKTAAKVAEQFRAAGFEVTQRMGGHGVVGLLRNGPGPVHMLRADLDALPVREETGLAFASRVVAHDSLGDAVPVMHACGHDVHMTVLVGAARVLSTFTNAWKGTLLLVAQPAEERGAGARAMLEDGLFERFPVPDHAFALHVASTTPSGSIRFVEGFALANVDSVDITVRGVGGHGAYPHTTKDPIVLAAQLVLAIQTIVSRELPPTEPAVVTVGSIHGGAKHNIIPDEVRLQLTLRSYSDDVRMKTIEAIRRIARGLAVAAGLPEDRMPLVEVKDEFTPATYNNPELSRRLAAAISGWLGPENVKSAEPVMGGEDFGQYGRTPHRIPVAMFWLGCVDPARAQASLSGGPPLPSLHSSKFAPDAEPTLKTGVLAMAAVIVELSARPK